MNLEDTIFSRARLGRYWTETGAKQCVEFFPVPYHFDPALEREFQRKFRTDYAEHLARRVKHNHSHNEPSDATI